LGKVPWVINKDILRVAHDCWENNIPLGDIPTQTNYDVPPQPIRPERQTDLDLDDKESESYKANVMEYKAFREAMRKFLRMKQKNMVRSIHFGFLTPKIHYYYLFFLMSYVY
jgi:DNA-directed RNA polymerase